MVGAVGASGAEIRSKEGGQWGVLGTVYSTITRPWFEDAALKRADPRDPHFYDADEIEAPVDQRLHAAALRWATGSTSIASAGISRCRTRLGEVRSGTDCIGADADYPSGAGSVYVTACTWGVVGLGAEFGRTPVLLQCILPMAGCGGIRTANIQRLCADSGEWDPRGLMGPTVTDR